MNPFSCVDEPVRKAVNPCEEESARIRHVAFVRKGTTVDKSSPAALQTSILAAVRACNGYIIKNVNGTYDGSTARRGKGRGSEPERTTGRGHSITFTDFEAVPHNVNFWNAAAYVGKNYNMYFMTGSQAWPVEGPNLDIDPTTPITDDAEATVDGEITVRWSHRFLPVPVACDMDLLGDNVELTLAGLATIVPGAQTIDGYNVTVVTGSNVKFSLGITGAEAYELVTGSTLPAGLTLDAATGVISGTAGAVAGPVKFSVTGSNKCGTAGNTVEITYTVTAA